MSVSYSANIMLYEIFDHANKLIKTNKAEAIEFLQKNRSRNFIESYLKFNYDPSIKFCIPSGMPDHLKIKDDVPDGYCLTDLKQEFRRMKIFLDDKLNLTRVRREQLWIQMCEGLFWKELILINKIKDRRITDVYDEFTVDFVREVFPNLLPNEVASPVSDEALAPVDLGEDPSLIPESQLIQEGIKQFLEEEATEEKKKLIAEMVKLPISANGVKERKKPGPKPKTSVSSTVSSKEQKKPGPKPKAKTDSTKSVTERKKPGPKPKVKVS